MDIHDSYDYIIYIHIYVHSSNPKKREMQYLSNCSDAFDHTRGKASSLLLTGVGNIWLDGTVRVKHHLMFPRGRFVHEQSS